MRVTKFVHSCLLVEHENTRIIIDPGSFSWQSGLVELHKWPKLDYVLITHMHSDHCWPDFLRALKDHSNPKVLTNSDVKTFLEEKRLDLELVDSVPDVEAVEVPHADLWGDLQAPANTIFTIGRKLTIAGDTHNLKKTAEVLAMPIYASWGSFKAAMETVMQLKPKFYLPVHDWFWSESGRDWHYDRAEETLKPFDVKFLRPENRATIEL